MGWQTDLFCNITFNKETFNSKAEVQERIEENKRYLQIAKDHIRDLAIMTEPNKFCPENYDPIIWMRNDLQDSLDTIEECSIELYKLNLLLDNWEVCHNKEGLAINPPEGITWNTAFLDGDFIRTIEKLDEID